MLKVRALARTLLGGGGGGGCIFVYSCFAELDEFEFELKKKSSGRTRMKVEYCLPSPN